MWFLHQLMHRILTGNFDLHFLDEDFGVVCDLLADLHRRYGGQKGPCLLQDALPVVCQIPGSRRQSLEEGRARDDGCPRCDARKEGGY